MARCAHNAGRKIAIRNNLIQNPVFVTGLSRSGKWMLSTILSSFERAEKVNTDYLMEQIIMMRMLGVLEGDVAQYLVRYAVDLAAYNLFIGRNVNIRPGDYTSILKTPGKSAAFAKRLLSEEGKAVRQRIIESDPLFIFLVHDALWHFDVYRDAFPRMKMVHMERHPVDVVFSWFSKGYGSDFALDAFNSTVTVNAGKKQFFYYTAGREDEYSRMSEADRVIRMVRDVSERHRRTYRSLSGNERKMVRIIIFEKFVTDPGPFLKDLAVFLATSASRYTPGVCRKKIKKLKAAASRKAFQALMDMADEYETASGLK